MFIKLQGHQVTFPLSPSLSLPFSQSFSPSFSICLSLFSCYTTLKGLVDSDELQCPTGNMLQRLSLELDGACMGVQLINYFIQLQLYSCVIMHVYKPVCERPHACHSYEGIPFGASVAEECHNKPIFVNTNTRSLSYRCSKCRTHLNVSDPSGIQGRWSRWAGWTGMKRNTQYTT